MTNITDELNKHLDEGIRKLNSHEEIDLYYVNRLSGLYQACHFYVRNAMRKPHPLGCG